MKKHFDLQKDGTLPKEARGYPDQDTEPSVCCGALVIYVENAKVPKCTKCGKREGYVYRDNAGHESTAHPLGGD